MGGDDALFAYHTIGRKQDGVAAGWQVGAEVVLVTPHMIRKTGYSKENKLAAAHMIPWAKGIPGHVSDDEADAIGCWWAAWTLWKQEWIAARGG